MGRLRLFRILGMVIIGGMLLSACAQATPEPITVKETIEITKLVRGTPETVVEEREVVVTATAEPAAPRDTLVFAQGTDAASLDPTNQRDSVSFSIVDHIYDTLVYRDRNKEIQPRLAESWSIIDDTTWEFNLRQDVVFHNGEPFDAGALKFSMDRELESGRKYTVHATMQLIEGVEIVDDYTIRVTTKEPYPLLLGALALRPYALAPGYVQEHGWDHLGLNPVGTGPYRFVEWAKDEHIKVEANPDYWGGEPPIKYLIFRPIPEDLARAAELMTGGVDIVRDLSPDLVDTVNDSEVAHVVTAPSAFHMYINFNSRGPFQDARVRQAVGLAIDREELIATVMGGLARRSPYWINPDAHGFDPDAQGFDYDPDEAKRLLAEAGYPDGLEMSMSFTPGAYLKVDELAQAVAGQLESVGITVALVTRERGLQLDLEAARDVPEDAWLEGGVNPRYDASILLWQMMHSDSTISYFPDPHDPGLDARLDGCMATMDPDARAECCAELTEVALEVVPWVHIFHLVNAWGVNNDVDYEGPADFMAQLWTASFK